MSLFVVAMSRESLRRIKEVRINLGGNALSTICFAQKLPRLRQADLPDWVIKMIISVMNCYLAKPFVAKCFYGFYQLYFLTNRNVITER